MRLSDFVAVNEHYQSSINIDFDFYSANAIETLVPTEAVCRLIEEILKDIIAPSTQRAKVLVGPYGTGKSHATLVAVSSMWRKSKGMYSDITEGFKRNEMPFAGTFERYAEDGSRLLPVIISGSSADLRRSLLLALRNALDRAGLSALMPETSFDGAIDVLARWRERYPQTLSKFEAFVGCSTETFESRLHGMDSSAYLEFVEVYPELTSGGSFDALSGMDVLGVFDAVLDGLAKKGISGIFVVYDEFSKYLESNMESAKLEDTKLLQDFAERCNRSNQDRQLHMLLIGHKSLGSYIDAKLPKDKVDGWRGVSGRFREIEMRNSANQFYELMAHTVLKDEPIWEDWLKEDHGANGKALDAMAKRYGRSGLFDEHLAPYVTRECFPLHPMTSFLLPILSEKVAQNERTLFTFMCSDEKKAMMGVVREKEALVGPDALFDYFEPILRRELFSSAAHKTYELARASLSRVDTGSLAAEIIKAVAIMAIVGRYDYASPTKHAIADIFLDLGYSEEEVGAALAELVGGGSVVYLRQSDSLLKLKESSGIRIDEAIEDYAGGLRSKISPCEILSSCSLSTVLYPSRHNEEHAIVRYYDCGFVPCSILRSANRGARIVDGTGDGFVVALLPESPEDMADVKALAQEYSSQNSLCVVAVHKRFVDVSDTLYKLEAARRLKEAAVDDEILSEEYEIAIEDYEETVSQFIDGYFRPELNLASYFASGKRKNGIRRRRRLSDLLSEQCDKAFPHTPLITSESLNKNELTGTALHSRAKIIKGLCAINLEPNLGFSGNGQETSMMRSSLQRTGVIPNLEHPKVNLKPDDVRTRRALSVIENFVARGGGSFQVLYNLLQGPSEGIGMKRGPIPLFLAVVLREHRDEIQILRNGEERPFSAEVLCDIDVNPGAYELGLIGWTPEMADYSDSVGELFGCAPGAGRNAVVDAMRMWYVSLPQVTRNSRVNHALPLSEERWLCHLSFIKALKKEGKDSQRLLFVEIPKAFHAEFKSDGIVEALRDEKAFCEGYVNFSIESMANAVRDIFAPGAHEEASLDSILRDWSERLPDAAKSHVLSGHNNQILAAVKSTTPDTHATICRIAKAATALRIEDWNDERFSDFPGLVRAAKEEAEGACGAATTGERRAGLMSISYCDEEGKEHKRTFDGVECSNRARLLRNSIVSCVDEMGGSLSPEEKRQVVFEVLKEMC